MNRRSFLKSMLALAASLTLRPGKVLPDLAYAPPMAGEIPMAIPTAISADAPRCPVFFPSIIR
jgi:hypothetical protein